MRRFLFKSPTNYKGYVEAIYDVSGKLWRINFSNATGITVELTSRFKNGIPVLCENMDSVFANAPIKPVEVEFEVTFDDFKREYPTSRNMYLAEPIWNKVTSAKQYSAFLAAIEYAKYLAQAENKWQKPMLPEKFLKTEQWKNDWKNL